MKTLYYGGPIHTMEREGESPYAVLTENGRIAALLTKAEAEAVTDARQIDLKGRTMLPGFIDAHSHFSGVAAALTRIDLDGCTDVAAIQRRIAAWMGQYPGDGWIVARGYDHNDLPDARHITRQELDAVCPDRPLWVEHKSGHIGVFNSCGLAAVGAEKDSPYDGLGKDENGELNGYMERAALSAYGQKVPTIDLETHLEMLNKAQELYFSYGITTVQEGAVRGRLPQLYAEAVRRQMLLPDVIGYAAPVKREEVRALLADCLKGYCGNLRIAGYKIFLDGSPQCRTAWMRRPYLGGDGKESGHPSMTDEAVWQAVKMACEEKVQLLAHCNGDAACEQYLQAFERARAEGYDVAALRPVMIHAQFLGADQIVRAKALGMILSFFVAHVWHWGDVHVRNCGPERGEHISRAAQALELGIPFTFHQDAPVIRPDMLETVWCAVNRRNREGAILGPELAVSPYQALQAVTVNAAYQYFEEQEKGSIAPGKLADFVILDRDPLAVPPEQLRDIRVCMTVKKDRIVFER